MLFTAVTLSGLTACGGDDDATPDDRDNRIGQITGVAEAATYAYAATNGEGLLDYLAADLAAECTKQDIERALAGEPVPTGFDTIQDVTFDGDDRASATVILKTAEGDRPQEWKFVREGDDSWRILEIPSLSREDCGTS
ncbi:MAG TPA: hypothetical protein VFP63_05330 [Dehalococcoidia bacterium]|nr:hypothetical protein [Dehalococcoidia bacterium]